MRAGEGEPSPTRAPAARRPTSAWPLTLRLARSPALRTQLLPGRLPGTQLEVALKRSGVLAADQILADADAADAAAQASGAATG